MTSDDDEILSDYVDGRMTSAEAAAFEERAAADAGLTRRLRLLRAMRASLSAAARPMPADLKAALKREARARAPKFAPSRLDGWRAALGGAPWTAYGLGGAFAAAALALGLRASVPKRPPQFSSPERAAAPVWNDAAAARGLNDLWTDDDGGTGDEG